jgi:predicted dehydrogenase
MNEIRWGIIGCGNVTEVKSGPAFNLVPNSKLLAVMRRDQQLLQDYALRHNVPLKFTNASELIQHPEIDAIYIATPPNVHEKYAIEALHAGKFVYVEKPMATSVAACLNMQSVANNLNGKLVIAHYRRSLPLFLKVKELLANNDIGKVNEVKIIMHKNAASKSYYENNWRVNKESAGGGLFYDLAPHQIDLVLYFFGEAISYQGTATNTAGLYEVEDTVAGTMLMQSGIKFDGDWRFAMEQGVERDDFIIKGELGVIRFSVFGHTITIEKENKQEEIEFAPPKHIQQKHIEKVVQYFLGKGENPCSVEEAIKSMRIMESFVYGDLKYK